MAKKEARTDLWVASQLKECGIEYDAQGSDVKEIDEALKGASKRGTGIPARQTPSSAWKPHGIATDMRALSLADGASMAAGQATGSRSGEIRRWRS